MWLSIIEKSLSTAVKVTEITLDMANKHGIDCQKCFPAQVQIDSMCKISIRGFTRNQG
jgi:hypothetical protein